MAAPKRLATSSAPKIGYAAAMSLTCQRCGACCFSDSTSYVPVTGADHRRLADDEEALTHFVGNRCYMRMVDGHCAALAVRAGRFVCTVYETRPAICRELHRGSPECRAEMTLKKVRARRALDA